MGYQRWVRRTNPRDSEFGRTSDYYDRGTPLDYGEDFGPDLYEGRSSARDYEAAGEMGRSYRRGGYGYGAYDQGYGDRESSGRRQSSGRDRPYYGSYASDGHRFADYGDERHQRARRGYGRQPQGYDYDDRGFMARAGDEVRSWFGDDEAERRREMDQRYDERYGDRWGSPYDRDDDYHSWRRQQIDALDRDYAEYRGENRQKFHNEFGSWRQERQGQRSALSRVDEHMEVVGSDGGHVGTVDKVRGDRIVLTKSDPDAGGHHHSIPSRWIKSVDDKVTIRKTADEAHAHWKDEERNQAMFRDNDTDRRDYASGHNLDRSFSGTY
ncbi:MAG TPA: DUF2171 domain-containing protein [Sphingomonas sp.]|nr:DUF2171 domain-containing protein [Sphingomonas sp.]